MEARSKPNQLNQSNTQFKSSSRGFGFLGFWGWGLSPATIRQKDKPLLEVLTCVFR